MARTTKAPVRSARAKSRSPKAGRPPDLRAIPARVRRRRKTARAAFRKDTTIHQAAQGPRAIWAASKPKIKKG
jgi:nucleoside-diphosphate-sugar epimerase